MMLPAKSGVGFSSDHNIKERIRPVGEVTNNDNNVKVTQAERCVRLNRRCVGNVLKKLVSRHDKSDTLRIFICSYLERTSTGDRGNNRREYLPGLV